MNCTFFWANFNCFHFSFQWFCWNSGVERHDGSDVHFNISLLVGFVKRDNFDVEAVTDSNVIQNFKAEFHILFVSIVNFVLSSSTKFIGKLDSFSFLLRAYQNQGRSWWQRE